MRKNFIISGLSILCFWLAACTDPFAKEEFVAYDEQPIGLYLETQPQFSDWVKLLKTADLFNAVNMSNIKYTCFVADNVAVEAYIKASGKWQSIDDITEEEAKNLLKYHIIPSDYAYSVLASGKLSTQTISGDYLTVSFDEGGVDRYVNGVKVLKKPEDVPQINGYYHQLEAVLDPIIYTVMEVLDQTPEYSIFTAAVRECGLDAYLGRRDIILNNTALRDFKAVMVVSDSLYRINGIQSVADLKTRFSGEPTDVKSEFYRYVGYHVYAGAYDFAELTDFAEGATGKNIESFIAREFLSVTDKNDSILLNPTGKEHLYFVPGKYDIPASNGFIHEVSGLMPISDPVRYAFVWEPTEWEECKLAPFYRTAKVKGKDKAEFYYFKPDDEITHFRWKTIPYKDNAVGYASEDVDWDRFTNDDYIFAELGQVGWLEFDTPTIMRGKYNIQIVKYAWFECKGKFQMYIDDAKFGSVINFAAAPGTQNMGDFYFMDSAPHVFRFNVVGDDGKFRLDRFIFTPVND